MHGDDYVSVGGLEQIRWMKDMLENKYQLKTQTLGPREDDVQQFAALNRMIYWDGNEGIAYEADPRHVEITVEQLQLKDVKTVSTPGTKDEGCTQEDKDEKLNNEEASKY